MSISERELRSRLLQAVKEMKSKSPKRNFVEAVELHIGIRDVDLKKPENRFRVPVRLPHPISNSDKIVFFADGAHVTALKDIQKNGEVTVIDKAKVEEYRSSLKMMKKLARRNRIFLASQQLMGIIGRYFGRILSPRNKMPIAVPPAQNAKEAVENAKRTVIVRLHKSPSINIKIGSRDMEDEKLVDNAMTVISAIRERLPKGYRNISSIVIKTTMGPPVKVGLEQRKK